MKLVDECSICGAMPSHKMTMCPRVKTVVSDRDGKMTIELFQMPEPDRRSRWERFGETFGKATANMLGWLTGFAIMLLVFKLAGWTLS